MTFKQHYTLFNEKTHRFCTCRLTTQKLVEAPFPLPITSIATNNILLWERHTRNQFFSTFDDYGRQPVAVVGLCRPNRFSSGGPCVLSLHRVYIYYLYRNLCIVYILYHNLCISKININSLQFQIHIFTNVYKICDYVFFIFSRYKQIMRNLHIILVIIHIFKLFYS